MLAEQPGGAVDVERVLGRRGQLGEGRRQAVDERRLGRRQARVVQRERSVRAPRPVPTSRSLRYSRRPRRKARVDGRVVGEDALGHAAGRGDDHDHQHLRLQREHLDAADRGGVERRRRDDRQQVRDLAERLARDAHRLVDLAAHELQVHPARASRGSAAEQVVDVVAVPGVGRHAPGATCAGARAGPAPRGSQARCGSSTGPNSSSGSAASVLEPTGWPVAL